MSYFSDIEVENLSNESREFPIELFLKDGVANGAYSMLIHNRKRGCAILSITAICSSGSCKVTAEYGDTYFQSESMTIIPGLEEIVIAPAGSAISDSEEAGNEDSDFVTRNQFFQIRVTETVDCFDLHIHVTARTERSN